MTYRIRLQVVSVLILAFLGLPPSDDAQVKRPLSVADVIEARSVITGLDTSVLLSPDGKRYAMVLLRGDLERNGSWVDVLEGETSSSNAARPTVVSHLFTKSTAQARDLVKDLRWLADNERLAFLWDDGKVPARLVTLNVRTREIKAAANAPGPIVQYGFNKSGTEFVYVAQKPPDPLELSRLRRGGFAVGDERIWSFLATSPDDLRWMAGYETFVVSLRAGNVQKRRVVEPSKRANIGDELLTVSPDGSHAIAVGPAPEAPPEWHLYTGHVFKTFFLPAARRHPEALNNIRQYQFIDVDHAQSRLLWNAPENPAGNVVWSPDGESVVIGPTFLPTEGADAEGLAGRAVVVLDVKSGLFKRLPVPHDHDDFGYRPVRWNKDGTIELGYADFWTDGKIKLTVRNTGGEWRATSEGENQEQAAPIRLELREDPNTPPRLFAVDTKTNKERMILDINPELHERELGRVEMVHWATRDGEPWTGMLYYPVHFSPDKHFPLVIQTHGYVSKEFSLEGGGTLSSAYAAQPLANIDIAVLQVGGPDSPQEWAQDGATPREPASSMSGYLGAIDHFSAMGIIDKDKVGLLGFSRTGWHVEYALTHSEFPFAAAIVADNINPGFFEYVLGENDYRSELEADLGSAPFGKGLESFLREAPDLNVEKIQTPLRIELDMGPMVSSVLLKWELFSLLKYLDKPVELFLVPDIQHGVHLLQNPAQRFASLSGTVDWFSFWLNEEEDRDPAKADQYARWRELRKLQEQKQTAAPTN